jgi:hypothetical protein
MRRTFAFIISSQRSGSNWLHRCLEEFTEVEINGEVNPSAALALLSKIRSGDNVSQKKLVGKGFFTKQSRSYVEQMIEQNLKDGSVDGQVLIDKSAYPTVCPATITQEQSEYCSLLDAFFPESKKILLVRDPRDVLVSFSSWKGQEMGGMLNMNPRSLFYFYRHFRNWCSLHEAWLSGANTSKNWLVMTYSDLKDNFKDSISSAANHLGVEFSEEKIGLIAEQLYSIDSAVYEKENKERGYNFFRTGQEGEWKSEFRFIHKIMYRVLFRSKVDTLLALSSKEKS